MVWWKDIDINLDKKHDGDILDYTDEQAIMQSIKNILLTKLGERRRLPTFARNLYLLLFEPIDDITAREIGDLLYGALIKWEKRIVIEKLRIVPKPDQGIYDITLKFYIRNMTTPEIFELQEIITAL